MPLLRRAASALFACLALALPGCTDDPLSASLPSGASPEAVISPQATPSAPITWEKCPLRTGGRGTRAECANITVPLDWNDPGGRRVTYFVKRLPGTSSGAHKQLWLLQGGPGGAGDTLETLADEVVSKAPAFDVYVPDHRGTGRSAYLGCPNAMAKRHFDPRACAAEAQAEWGASGFAAFTTTNAARDLGYAIERTRAEGQEVHVYGVSYGTYLAQRYLQIFPTQPTAVTLDGVCQAGLCSYMKIGYWFDRIGKKYLGECAANASCAEKLGPNPIATVKEALAIADAGTCPGIAGVDAAALRQLFSYFIASFDLRVLIPSTAYRIVRCSPDDAAALEHMTAALSRAPGGPFAPAGELSSEVLGLHIAFSELEEDPPALSADLEALFDDPVFTTFDATVRDVWESWPRYPHDEWVGKYPSSNVPILMLNGTLDPQTPQEFAEQIAPHYAMPAQSLVLLPRAAHCTLTQSPTSTWPGTETCGMNVWRQFLAAPAAALDTSCRDRILTHDFAGSPSIAQYFYGEPSLWGGATTSSAAPLDDDLSGVQVEWERAIRAVGPRLDLAHRRRAD
ncbi:MAG: alpha/beta fold hydrolase [Labilithrix sp.]|nr:alpha/beta fold hydrolase [Labilithrix sp.]